MKLNLLLFSMRVSLVSLSATISIGLPLNASAETTKQTDVDFEKIVVTATKSAREINEIAANITSIGSDRVDAITASDIRDLLRYEPGVTVEGGGRFGLSDINIRGINGDRVLILIDGVPIADEFSFGPNLSSRRDFIDIDLIKQVDIIRGPASTLYGSDAIGGVVAFTSKDPSDLVESGESFDGRIKAGYISQSDETYVNAQIAGLGDSWQWLINAGYRDIAETSSFFNSSSGNVQQTANPQEGLDKNALIKVIWSPSVEHRLSVVAETFDASLETDVNSDLGTVVSRGVALQTTGSFGDDSRSRDRFSAHYMFMPQTSVVNRFTFDAYSQSSATAQHTELFRTQLSDPPLSSFRTRDSAFEQDTVGVLSQIDFQFQGDIEQYLIVGIEWQKTDSEALREGQTVDVMSGVNIPEFTFFPARDFPISSLTESAIYIQDEIQVLDGKLLISPGIRYDKFKLEAKPDGLFEAANPGVEVSDFDDSEVSTKLGIIYTLSPDANIWLQWAEGFRIPPMDDLNVGFTNFRGGYTSLANPNLRSETVKSIELGWRQSFDNLSFSVSAYRNDYEDFIESLASLGFNPITNLLEFQARNIDDVEIKGVDVSVNWQLEDWQLRLASSWQDSEDESTGQELESVLPSQTVVGLQYGTMDSPWRLEFVGTYIAEATVIEPEQGQPEPFVAASTTLFDVLAHFQVNEDIRLNAGVFNLGDRQYWSASEVRGRAADDNLDRFTAPGRNFAVNLIYSF